MAKVLLVEKSVEWDHLHIDGAYEYLDLDGVLGLAIAILSPCDNAHQHLEYLRGPCGRLWLTAVNLDPEMVIARLSGQRALTSRYCPECGWSDEAYVKTQMADDMEAYTPYALQNPLVSTGFDAGRNSDTKLRKHLPPPARLSYEKGFKCKNCGEMHPHPVHENASSSAGVTKGRREYGP